MSLLDRPVVAVIGSRFASPRGLELAAEVARELVAIGVVVATGLAAGIDAAAHRTTPSRRAADHWRHRDLPPGRAFPSAHARLQELVYREHLLVSPFAPDTVTRRGHFPARNRAMARIAAATVLVEAGENSGTVHQVRESLLVGRPVLIAERLSRRPTCVQWPTAVLGANWGCLVWGKPRTSRSEYKRCSRKTGAHPAIACPGTEGDLGPPRGRGHVGAIGAFQLAH